MKERNTSRVATITVLLGLVALAACAPPAPGDSAEIRARSAAWKQAVDSGNIDAVAALYTEDCKFLPPNAGLGRGRAAVKAAIGPMIEAGMKIDMATIEAVAAGDVGYHIGTYTVRAQGAEIDHGKFIEVWRKVAGSWQILGDTWNSDVPLPVPSTATLTITHEVSDPARWLAAWQGADSRHKVFAEHGASSVRVFQSPDDPKRVGLVVELSDPDAFDAFMVSSEAAAAKAEDGVIDATIRFVKEVR